MIHVVCIHNKIVTWKKWSNSLCIGEIQNLKKHSMLQLVLWIVQETMDRNRFQICNLDPTLWTIFDINASFKRFLIY